MAEERKQIEWKPIPGFPNYQISNQGDVCLVKLVKRYGSRIQLSDRGKSRATSIPKLLHELFGIAPSREPRLPNAGEFGIVCVSRSPVAERDEIIIGRRTGGETLASIAKDYGLTRQRVCKITNYPEVLELNKQAKRAAKLDAIRPRVMDVKNFIDANAFMKNLRAHAPIPDDIPAYKFVWAFKEICGVGIDDYIQNVWAEQVKLKLSQGAKSRDIAAECKFGHENQVSMKFRRIVGISPSKWLKQLLLSKSAA